MASEKFVWLTNDPDKAFSNPVFVIKKGDVYYKTLALWEYDEGDAKTQKQVVGCKNIAAQFALLSANGLEVREWPDGPPGGGGGGDHTQPDNP